MSTGLGSTGLGGGLGGGGLSGTPAPKGHGGLVTFVKHLGSDVKDAAMGIPMGLVLTAEHPIRAVEAMVTTTWHDWSPLFHGDAHKWWTQSLQHPLAPILDVTSAMTLAAGAASIAAAPFTGGMSLAELPMVAGELAAEAGARTEVSTAARIASSLARVREPLVRYVDTPEGVRIPLTTRYTSPNPLVRMRQKAIFKMMQATRERLPVWGSASDKALLEREMGRRAVARDATSKDVLAQHAQLANLVLAGQLMMPQFEKAQEGLLRHMKLQLDSHALPGSMTALPKGWIYVTDHRPMGARFWRIRKTANNTFVHEVDRRFGSTKNPYGFFTEDAAKALKDTHGNPLIVPTHSARNFGLEAQNSAHFLSKLWRKPADVWKILQVGWTPKMVANNTVGNVFMYLMDAQGPHAVTALFDAARMLKGDSRALHELAATGRYNPHWLQEKFRDVLNTTNAAGLIGPMSDIPRATSRVGRIAKSGLYPLVHKQEQYLKAASIIAAMKGAPEVRALMREDKLSFNAAARLALEHHPELRQRVAQDAMRTMGDYQTFSHAERGIRNFIPFYSWDRHVARHAVAMVSERPMRADALAHEGQYGSGETARVLGDLPSFLKSILPVGPPGPDGRVPILDTRGLNPYASVSDLVDAGTSLAFDNQLKPGETIGAQLNPLITGIAEQLTGKGIVNPEPPAKHGGLVESVLVNTFNNTPEGRIARQLAFGNPNAGSSATLYDHSMRSLIASFLGAPLKRVNPDAAHKYAQEEAKPPTPRKKKKTGLGLSG